MTKKTKINWFCLIFGIINILLGMLLVYAAYKSQYVGSLSFLFPVEAFINSLLGWTLLFKSFSIHRYQLSFDALHALRARMFFMALDAYNQEPNFESFIGFSAYIDKLFEDGLGCPDILFVISLTSKYLKNLKLIGINTTWPHMANFFNRVWGDIIVASHPPYTALMKDDGTILLNRHALNFGSNAEKRRWAA